MWYSSRVALVNTALFEVKDVPTWLFAQYSLRHSLVNLESVLLGRKKLHDIAHSAISNPVDPKALLGVGDIETFDNHLDAIRIAESWDQLHAEYSPEKHDNVTVASVASFSDKGLWRGRSLLIGH